MKRHPDIIGRGEATRRKRELTALDYARMRLRLLEDALRKDPSRMRGWQTLVAVALLQRSNELKSNNQTFVTKDLR